MNLLLLLSALLSALTGIGGTVRAPDVAQAVAGQAAVAATVTVPRSVPTHRPANIVTAMPVAMNAAPWSIAPARPVWTGRRRE